MMLITKMNNMVSAFDKSIHNIRFIRLTIMIEMHFRYVSVVLNVLTFSWEVRSFCSEAQPVEITFGFTQ